MVAAVYDRLTVSGAAIFDRLTSTAGAPTITAIGTVQDGATFTLTGTSFSASGNLIFLIQGSKILQVTVGSEGTTSITSAALDTSGLYLLQSVSIYMTNSSGVASNVVTVPIVPATGQAVIAITQEFLGDPSSRISASPDIAIGDEIRLRNFTGLNVTGQGVPDTPVGTPTFEAAAFDGSSLGAWGLQTFALAASTINPPNVTGFTLAAAQAAITAAGLIPAIAATIPSVSVAQNSIITQFPPHSASVALGTVVELTVSQGIIQGLVPDLIGSDLASALNALSIAGITLDSISYIAGGADLIITNQTLGPGETVPAGSLIGLEMSLGNAANVTVPDLSPDTEAQARYAAIIGYLVPSVTYVQSSIRAGYVVNQSPLAGQSVSPGSHITIFVSASGGGLFTSFLDDSTSVPTTATFVSGQAFKQDGSRYVALWPANNAVFYDGPFAYRQDGALIISTTGTQVARPQGVALTYRGEVISAVDTPVVTHNGWTLLQDGTVCMSDVGGGGGGGSPSGTIWADIWQDIWADIWATAN